MKTVLDDAAASEAYPTEEKKEDEEKEACEAHPDQGDSKQEVKNDVVSTPLQINLDDENEESLIQLVLGPGWNVDVVADDVPSGKGHTTWYLITTTDPEYKKSWTQHRRYSELRELRRHLGTNFGGFPSRLVSVRGSLLKQSNALCLKEKNVRARELADWLQGVVTRAPELDVRGTARLHAMLGLPLGQGSISIMLPSPHTNNSTESPTNVVSPSRHDEQLSTLLRDLENERARRHGLVIKADADVAARVAENAKLFLENQRLRYELELFKPKPPSNPPSASHMTLCCGTGNTKKQPPPSSRPASFIA